MILSFADKETKKVWDGIVSRKLPYEIQNTARRKLRYLNSAKVLNDLRIPPANRLEQLAGDLSGYHSIRINRQWRLVFRWESSDAYEVQIIDYH